MDLTTSSSLATSSTTSLVEGCLTLPRRLVEVLKPDGRLVIQDFVSGFAGHLSQYRPLLALRP